MDGSLMEKLKILADSAKYDVSCSTSGVERKNVGRIGNASCAGICHSWSADGRCISLLKVLFSNKCVYDCQYCVNRRSVEVERASFEPEELARLTMEFYRRNYIEGLFLSSAVEVSPDYTAERILRCLKLLRNDYGFAGYIHAKIIPGVSSELTHAIGMVADRLSVNIELPTSEGLEKLAPQKKPKAIFNPMRQITTTLIEQKSLKGPGRMFNGQNLNSSQHQYENNLVDSGKDEKNNLNFLSPNEIDFLSPSGNGNKIAESLSEVTEVASGNAIATLRKDKYKEKFAPAGQTTQMIIGASGESDRQIIKMSEQLYQNFKMKRVYFSAYIPVSSSPLLPDVFTAPPLGREHRLYQADWLLRFYGFTADELVDDNNPNLEENLDPKISWALRHIERFPIEVNKANLDELLRIPGVGTTSAFRILRQRKLCKVKYEDLKKMGVVLKRARFFLTCSGKFYGGKDVVAEEIRNEIVPIEKAKMSLLSAQAIRHYLSPIDDERQISMFR